MISERFLNGSVYLLIMRSPFRNGFLAPKPLVIYLLLGPKPLRPRLSRSRISAALPLRPRMRMRIIVLIIRTLSLIHLCHFRTNLPFSEAIRKSRATEAETRPPESVCKPITPNLT